MEVTAGIFVKDDHILLMRRAPGQSAAGGWEYPGGKIEPGESGEQCLHRELNEELCIDAEGKIQLTVHDQMEWVPLSKLLDHDQLPADYLISQKLLEVLR